MNTLQRRFPHPLQFSGWLQKRLPLRKNQKCLARNQLPVQLSHECAKDSLCPIAPDGITKALADYNPNPTRSIIHLVR
jgi:hypothetical protein